MKRESLHKKKKRKRIPVAHRNVILANKLDDPLKSLSSFCKYEKDGLKFVAECNRCSVIDTVTLNWILDLEERNMKSLYENCDWGWNYDMKKQEMTNKKAWYLIARSSTNSNLGFCHFRFDMDYGSSVLYCYEIQLEENVRGLGLGKFLMNLLEHIAFTNSMEKVILTVFKHNTIAYHFFTSLGYKLDVTSPEDDDEKKYCYVILSKTHMSSV